jgi:hypothetical protein
VDKAEFCREKLLTLRVPEASGHIPEHPENAINVTAVIEPGERMSANLGAVSIERQVIQRNGYACASDKVFHGKKVWSMIANCRLAEIVRMFA